MEDNMWELTVLAIAIAVIGVWFFFKKASPSGDLDVNKDGKVDVADVKEVGKKAKAGAKKAAGKVKKPKLKVAK